MVLFEVLIFLEEGGGMRIGTGERDDWRWGLRCEVVYAGDFPPGGWRGDDSEGFVRREEGE